MFTCTRMRIVIIQYNIRNNTVFFQQKFILLQFGSKSGHRYWMHNFRNWFLLKRKSELFCRAEIIDTSGILVQKGQNIYNVSKTKTFPCLCSICYIKKYFLSLGTRRSSFLLWSQSTRNDYRVPYTSLAFPLEQSQRLSFTIIKEP